MVPQFVRSDEHIAFVLADLDPRYHEAVRHLDFQETPQDFARLFPLDTPDTELAFEHFAAHAPTFMRQAAYEVPMPWEDALETWLQCVEQHDIDWWLVGSTALAVRGIPIKPYDIDLSVMGDDALRLNALFADTLTEPTYRVTDWFCNWFGRAFLGGIIEWVGNVDERADTPETSDFGPTALSQAETVIWHGHSLRVPPLHMQLASNQRCGRDARAELIEAHIAEHQK